jgi:membrane fusion protein (multidrug efflux system)
MTGLLKEEPNLATFAHSKLDGISTSTALRGSAPRTVAAVAALAALLISVAGCEKKAPPAMGPPDVEVVTAIQKDVPIYGDWVGTLDGYTNAQIQPQVTGYLIKQNYREGSYVHKGDVLFEIDPRPFQAVLDQAKGQLAQAKAQLDLANINVNRDLPMAKLHAIAQSQLDTDTQTKASAEATVQATAANVEQAELNLGFTKVLSLIDGVAGLAQTQIGNLVATTTVLTSVSQVDPIKVYFPISEQEYLRLTGKAKGSVDMLSTANSVPLQLTLANGEVYPQSGKIIFTNRQVDPQTGTIQVVGSFRNPGNILRPGQFGRIRALIGNSNNAVLIPQRAVTELQGTFEVAVVGDDNKISIRKVTTGERTGTFWIIQSGLKPGERVVSEGIQKVREGSTVVPKVDNSAAESESKAQ